jgi:hypothetical protein
LSSKSKDLTLQVRLKSASHKQTLKLCVTIALDLLSLNYFLVGLIWSDQLLPHWGLVPKAKESQKQIRMGATSG